MDEVLKFLVSFVMGVVGGLFLLVVLEILGFFERRRPCERRWRGPR